MSGGGGGGGRRVIITTSTGSSGARKRRLDQVHCTCKGGRGESFAHRLRFVLLQSGRCYTCILYKMYMYMYISHDDVHVYMKLKFVSFRSS